MRKVLLAVALFAVASFAQANSARDITEVSFKGAKSCAVYLAQVDSDNLVAICDGQTPLLVMDAPRKEILGETAYKAITDAYGQIAVKKCVAAGLTSIKVINNDTFFGVFCNVPTQK